MTTARVALFFTLLCSYPVLLHPTRGAINRLVVYSYHLLTGCGGRGEKRETEVEVLNQESEKELEAEEEEEEKEEVVKGGEESVPLLQQKKRAKSTSDIKVYIFSASKSN